MTSQHEETIHMPEPSYWPLVLATGVVMIAAGVLLTPYLMGAGLLVLLSAIAGWSQENRDRAAEEEGNGE